MIDGFGIWPLPTRSQRLPGADTCAGALAFTRCTEGAHWRYQMLLAGTCRRWALGGWLGWGESLGKLRLTPEWMLSRSGTDSMTKYCNQFHWKDGRPKTGLKLQLPKNRRSLLLAGMREWLIFCGWNNIHGLHMFKIHLFVSWYMRSQSALLWWDFLA